MNTSITMKKKPLVGLMKLSIMSFMIGLLVNSLEAKAQQGLYDYKDFTPYEKQRCDLTNEAMEKITKVMESLSPYDQMSLGLTYAKVIENAENEYDLMLAHENFMTTLFGVSSLTEPETYYEYQVMEEFKSIAKWYFPQRTQVEKKRTALDDAREKERNSGKETLNRNVKSAFLSWAKKGEYEKRDEYLMRLQEQAIEKFDSICTWHCISQFFHNLDEKEIGYDADNETYSFRLFHKINVRDEKEQAPVVMTANMPVEEAKILGKMQSGTVVPLNLYCYQGYLCTKTMLFPYRYQGKQYNYYFKGDFESNESVTILYDDLRCNDPELNEVMVGYVFDYNQCMDEMIRLTDSLNQMAHNTYSKIDNLRKECKKIEKQYTYCPWSWDEYLRMMHSVFKSMKKPSFASDFWDAYSNFLNYLDPVTIVTSKLEYSERLGFVVLCDTTGQLFVLNAFRSYRFLFNSDKEFTDFFFSEEPYDINKLQDNIRIKFNELTASIVDASELHGAKDKTVGQNMLNYCYLIQEGPFLQQYTRELLTAFVDQNKILSKEKKRYDKNNLLENHDYDTFIKKYIKGEI